MGQNYSSESFSDLTPYGFRYVYLNEKTYNPSGTGSISGQLVYTLIKNSLINPPPFLNDDTTVHLQTFVSSLKINQNGDIENPVVQIAYDDNPNQVNTGNLKTMMRYEKKLIPGDIPYYNSQTDNKGFYTTPTDGNKYWSPWVATSGNLSETGTLVLNNQNNEDLAKICIGDTCLSQRTLKNILLSSSSTVNYIDSPYIKDKDTGNNYCNIGYQGQISYSSDGKGLTGCNICNRGYYNDDYKSQTCKFCPSGYYCPTLGTKNKSEFQVCASGYYCPEGSIVSNPFVCPSGYYCQTGTIGPNEYRCPSGYYCPEGSIVSNQF